MMCEAGATSLTSIPLRQEGRRREEHAAADREGVAPVNVPGAHEAIHGTELALARAAGQVLQRRVGLAVGADRGPRVREAVDGDGQGLRADVGPQGAARGAGRLLHAVDAPLSVTAAPFPLPPTTLTAL